MQKSEYFEAQEVKVRQAVLEVLKKSEELLSDRANWTTGCSARDRNREQVHPKLDKAVCFCAQGAITKFANMAILGLTAILSLQSFVGKEVHHVNDEDGYEAVMNMFRSFLRTYDPDNPRYKVVA